MTSSVRKAAAAAAAVAALGVVTGLFLSLYTSHHYGFPVGYDTPKYVWRANLVEAGGPSALVGSAQRLVNVNADRPGYPVLVALLHAVSGIRPFDLTFVLPAVVAGVIALASGAFGVRVLRDPAWAFAAYAIGVGASVNVALIAIGYADTLLASSVLVAAATTAVLAAGGERSIAATAVLVAGATVVHWNFAVMFLAVVLGLLLLLLPESVSARREGRSLFGTPSGRLGIAVATSAAAGAAAFLLVPAGPQAPSLGTPQFIDKIHRDVPQYRFASLGPAAALGAVALWFGDRVRRRGLALVLVWSLAGAAAVALLLLGASVPAHRILAFSFGIPILVVAGMVAVARALAGRIRTVGAAIGAIVVLGSLAGTSFLGYRIWSGSVPWVKPPGYVQSEAAGQYLEAAGGSRPVVFVVDVPALATGAVTLPFRIIRSALPGDQVGRTYVYVGTAQSALAGVLTVVPGNARFNLVSQHFFQGVRPVLRRDPIVIALRAFDRHFERLAGTATAVSTDVLVLRGPGSTRSIPEPPAPTPHSDAWLAGVTAAVLAVLFAAGLGWSVALVPGTLLVRAALAPAFGVATLALAGVGAGRLGAPLRDWSGIAIVVVTAALGWLVFAGRPRGVHGAPIAGS